MFSSPHRPDDPGNTFQYRGPEATAGKAGEIAFRVCRLPRSKGASRFNRKSYYAQSEVDQTSRSNAMNNREDVRIVIPSPSRVPDMGPQGKQPLHWNDVMQGPLMVVQGV